MQCRTQTCSRNLMQGIAAEEDPSRNALKEDDIILMEQSPRSIFEQRGDFDAAQRLHYCVRDESILILPSLEK